MFPGYIWNMPNTFTSGLIRKKIKKEKDKNKKKKKKKVKE